MTHSADILSYSVSNLVIGQVVCVFIFRNVVGVGVVLILLKCQDCPNGGSANKKSRSFGTSSSAGNSSQQGQTCFKCGQTGHWSNGMSSSQLLNQSFERYNQHVRLQVVAIVKVVQAHLEEEVVEVQEVEQEVVEGVVVVVEDDLQKPSRGSVFLGDFGRRTLVVKLCTLFTLWVMTSFIKVKYTDDNILTEESFYHPSSAAFNLTPISLPLHFRSLSSAETLS